MSHALFFPTGQSETAHQLLQRCLDRAPNSIPSLLMMAQINLYQGNPKLSMQSLEQALSRHFEVQSYPLYHLVRARVVRAQENMAQAVASLKTAMSLLTSSSKKQSPSLSSSSSLLPPLTLGEKLDVYLELASAYTKMGQQVCVNMVPYHLPNLIIIFTFCLPYTNSTPMYTDLTWPFIL